MDDQYQASHRFARISARKARLVMDLIRGESVEKALTKLHFCQRRASPMIGKVVKSAVANATQKSGAEPEELVVWRAFVDEGPTSKRWRPRAQGRAYPRLRRTCHLSVILTRSEDGGESSKKASPEGGAVKGRKKAAAKADEES